MSTRSENPIGKSAKKMHSYAYVERFSSLPHIQGKERSALVVYAERSLTL
jgi:hypothetical protein